MGQGGGQVVLQKLPTPICVHAPCWQSVAVLQGEPIIPGAPASFMPVPVVVVEAPVPPPTPVSWLPCAQAANIPLTRHPASTAQPTLLVLIA